MPLFSQDLHDFEHGLHRLLLKYLLIPHFSHVFY